MSPDRDISRAGRTSARADEVELSTIRKAASQRIVELPSRASSLEYANARIRGRRKHLLTEAQYERMLETGSLAELLVVLGSTRYRDDVDSVSLTNSGPGIVGLAASDVLHREFALVIRLLSDPQRRALIALAAEWDVEDIKTVVRGVFAGEPPEEIVSSFGGPGVTISHAELGFLARQSDVEGVVALASTLSLPYRSALRAGAERYAVNEALVEFEASLDQSYATWAAHEFQRARGGSALAREYFGRRVDARNIITAMRWARAVEAPDADSAYERYFLAGGFDPVVEELFPKLVAMDSVEDVVKALRHSRYAQLLKQSLPEYLLSGSLSEFDRAMQAAATRDVISEGRRDLLGLGLSVAYIVALQNEALNLRILAHGKAFGIPSDLLRREMLIV